jgi:hypothetical protein
MTETASDIAARIARLAEDSKHFSTPEKSAFDELKP